LYNSNQVLPNQQESLRNWLNFKVDDVPVLLDFMNQRLRATSTSAGTTPSLLIHLSQSQTDDLKKYRVEAWLLPNPHQYNHTRAQGCKPLTICEDADRTFTWDEVPALIQQCLNQAAGGPGGVCDPTLEVFLPFVHLNEAVDTWIMPSDAEDPFADPDALPNQLGWRYRIVLRSTERASRGYQEKNPQKIADWKEKWRRADAVLRNACQARSVLIEGNDPADQRTLNQRLAPLDAFGVKFAQVRVNKEIATALSAAVPIAVWLRQTIPNAQDSLNAFLNCHLHEVPQQAQACRSNACNPDTDLGCHLALLWDNPHLLPPRKNQIF
jgi:hypothetical protein